MVVDWYGALYYMFELSDLNLLQSIGAFVTLVVKYSITKAPNVRRVWCRISCRGQLAITCLAEVDSVQDRSHWAYGTVLVTTIYGQAT